MESQTVDRRDFLGKAVSLVTLSVMAASKPSFAAQDGTMKGMGKLVFVLHRRADVSHETCVAEWIGPQHTGIVGKLPGLRRWVQNHPHSRPEGGADGIGELWFDDVSTLEQAMSSPEMAAAVEDAKRFLDLQKTYALVVSERAIQTR